MIFSILPSVHADLGETRDQIIARYGRPYSESKNNLYFKLKDDEGVEVILGSDGKSVKETYDYIRDVGQKHVMEILKRNSKDLAWDAYRLYLEIQDERRYRQPELGMRAVYVNREEEHDSVYCDLTVELLSKH